MPSINRVFLMGHVGKEARVKEFGGGIKVADFSLATTEKWKKDNEWQEATTWHIVKGWKFVADAIEKLEKGDLVMVEGKINTESWDKDGETRSKTVIVADKVHFLRHKGGHGESVKDDGTPDDPDLPF